MDTQMNEASRAKKPSAFQEVVWKDSHRQNWHGGEDQNIIFVIIILIQLSKISCLKFPLRGKHPELQKIKPSLSHLK